ncbi:hypothetical protein LJC33_08840, partial [Eubacteriales bacterium OttesenSCG-928-N13]|nr:hypothetical protein [Eubacteriales bacterium OttesenSCG-928-N13]
SNLKYLGEDGDIVQLAVPKKWNMFLMLLQQDSKRQLIEQQMAEAYGRPMHAQIVAEGESQPKPARPPAQQSLQQAYDLFGRENVSVLDE